MAIRAFKLWRTAGAAALMVTAAACGAAGESGGEKAGEGGEGSVSAAPPAAPAASGGGEAGEAGAAQAYAGVRGEQLTALRLQHLKGFLMIAQRVAEGGLTEEAAVLIQQGLLEVYDPAPADFGAFNVTPVRAAAEATGLTRAQMIERIGSAIAAIDAARGALDVDDAALAARMADIAAGLYQHVILPDAVDPLEYQHSMGAALAARDALAAAEADLRAENATAFTAALAELDRFVALWPQISPTTRPATYRDVLAQSSRVRLALYPLL